MKTNSGKGSMIIVVLLYVLSALFLAYGIYMVCSSVSYVQTYASTAAVSTVNILQYVVSNSALYFGFAITIFAVGYLLHRINKYILPVAAPAMEEVEIAHNEPVVEPTTNHPMIEKNDTEPVLKQEALSLDFDENVSDENVFDENVFDEKSAASEKMAVEPLPTPDEEKALLTYKTVDINPSDSVAGRQSDTMRLKKSDQEALSSDMIRSIFEEKR